MEYNNCFSLYNSNTIKVKVKIMKNLQQCIRELLRVI
jgi:hypothetical protein